jgi:hypothetical protein
MCNKTIVDAVGILRRFLSARGFEETDAVEDRYDGHAMLAELAALTVGTPETQIYTTVAKVIVHLERGFQFEGSPLIDLSYNPWKVQETEYVTTGLPRLSTAVEVARHTMLLPQ